MRIESVGRAEFAEIAEALDLTTLDIVGAVQEPGSDEVTVFFTENTEEWADDPEAVKTAELLSTTVTRGRNGIFIRSSEKIERGNLHDLLRRGGY